MPCRWISSITSLPRWMANQAASRLSVWSPWSRMAWTSASVRSTRYVAMTLLTRPRPAGGTASLASLGREALQVASDRPGGAPVLDPPPEHVVAGPRPIHLPDRLEGLGRLPRQEEPLERRGNGDRRRVPQRRGGRGEARVHHG